MKIGEFAKVCNTKISVLRHYDKQNLLKPVYIDGFTGYRYYSASQIAVFFRITALKQAGFSLGEIKDLVSQVESDAEILEIFEKKKKHLLETLHNLEEAREMVIGVDNRMNVIFAKENGTTVAKHFCEKSGAFSELCEQMEQMISAKNYQRISVFKVNQETREIACQVIRLAEEVVKPREKIDLPFEEDAAVIGKWEAVGEYAVKEEFYQDRACKQNWYYEYPRVVYFLPEGERYWCYGWTKGKLLIDAGDSTTVNEYEVEEIDGERFMFVSFKTYDYCRGGVPKILVLKQVSQQRYNAKELARKDDIDMPFEDDRQVLGKWKVFDFILSKEEFSAEGSGEPPIFFKEIQFHEGGSCTSVYGEEIISGDDKQVWTKGYVLRKWNNCACAYEIRTVDGRDYLIIEWKSGDYRWGGFPTDYYVFVRA